MKLGGDLGLVSQISMHVFVLRFICFLYCKQTKEQKYRRNRENHGFTKLVFLCRAESDLSETWWGHPDKY
jgi:hypothetical protein